jgi:hypothetical protein
VPAKAKVTGVTALDAGGKEIARIDQVGPALWPLPPIPPPATK